MSNHFPNKNTSKINCNYIPFDAQSLSNRYTSKIKCNYILFNSNQCYLTFNCFLINIHKKLSVITSYLIYNHLLNVNISKINCNYILFDSNYFLNKNIRKINCN